MTNEKSLGVLEKLGREAGDELADGLYSGKMTPEKAAAIRKRINTEIASKKAEFIKGFLTRLKERIPVVGDAVSEEEEEVMRSIEELIQENRKSFGIEENTEETEAVEDFGTTEKPDDWDALIEKYTGPEWIASIEKQSLEKQVDDAWGASNLLAYNISLDDREDLEQYVQGRYEHIDGFDATAKGAVAGFVKKTSDMRKSLASSRIVSQRLREEKAGADKSENTEDKTDQNKLEEKSADGKQKVDVEKDGKGGSEGAGAGKTQKDQKPKEDKKTATKPTTFANPYKAPKSDPHTATAKMQIHERIHGSSSMWGFALSKMAGGVKDLTKPAQAPAAKENPAAPAKAPEPAKPAETKAAANGKDAKAPAAGEKGKGH